MGDVELQVVSDVKEEVEQEEKVMELREEPRRWAMIKPWIARLGFMMDAYDLFIINGVVLILSKLYHVTKVDKSNISTAVLVGTVFGNIIIGAIADKIGRTRAMVLSMGIIIIGTILSAFASGNVLVFLMVARLILGVGVGGEYPLNAAAAAEQASSSKSRGFEIAATFSLQGVGALLAPTVVYICVLHLPLHYAWRVSLGWMAVPCLMLLILRLTLKESHSFQKASAVNMTMRDKLRIISGKYRRSIIGTCLSWFLLDIEFYANGLFAPTIISMSGVKELSEVMKYTIFLAMAAIPGYFVNVAIIDKIGRVRLQWIGFLVLGGIYLILALSFKKLTKEYLWAFIVLYALTFFVSNAGPNTTTFVLPSELFPTKIRATCHGISAACGKLGAIVGAYMMTDLLTDFGVPCVLYICSGVSIAGLVVTLVFLKETKGEEMPEE